ncbi:hypothetical protein CLMAG_32240 [Clostridium magnum DSM 2767]|uniref:Uncharacterized protein n=1 Tax=Clostridium magnum DSM 2767 TaxID=1121326 RepID=A0A161WIF7_9CLOT|nr:hypothetical protein CLMAG_32240 [Clostridium magnum DSM 2767]
MRLGLYFAIFKTPEISGVKLLLEDFNVKSYK